MKDTVRTHSVRQGMTLALLGLCLFAPVVLRGPARAQTNVTAEQTAVFLKDPMYFYFDARFRDALAYSEVALSDPNLPAPVRDRVLLTVGTIWLAQRRVGDARSAFLKMLAGDPAKDLEDPEKLPPTVTKLFYQLRDSLCMTQLQQLVESQRLAVNIHTLAIGDIENNSIVKTDFDADHLCRGLVHVLTGDLQSATSLRLVDRQRLSVLLEELKLTKDPGLMNPEARVQMGQLTGAQSYLFGQYMQLDHTHARIDLRWVNTATGEILLARSVEGSTRNTKEIFELERKLALEILAPEIGKYTGQGGSPGEMRQKLQQYLDQKATAVTHNTGYRDAILETGRAVSQEGAGDYGKAAVAWNNAAKLNPADKIAKTRGASLVAYQKAGQQ